MWEKLLVRIIIHTFRYKIKGYKKLILFISKYLIPKPDFIFIMTGDPNKIYQRKKEISISNLKRLNKIYKNFSISFKNSYLIDTTKYNERDCLEKMLFYLEK